MDSVRLARSDSGMASPSAVPCRWWLWQPFFQALRTSSCMNAREWAGRKKRSQELLRGSQARGIEEDPELNSVR